MPVQSMLAAMGAALRRHGSPRLRADLDAYEPWILGLLDGCGSLEELLSRLETTSPTLST